MASVPLTSDADWASFARPNDEFEALYAPRKGFNFVGPNTTIASLRAQGVLLAPSEKWEGVEEKDVKITVRDGTVNRARVYSPTPSDGDKGKGKEKHKPLLVLIYGGGWVVGNLEQEEGRCRGWVRNFGGVAIAVEHRLCPDVKFPVPIEDTFDALKWIAANHKSLGADPSKGFVIGGTSSGASTMITISHLWRDQAITPPITGLFISVPILCVVSAVPEKYKSQIISWEQMKDAPIFDRKTSDFLKDSAYVDPADPIRSPLLWPTGHKDLPPTYFIIAGSDPWRDVGLLYEQVLREENGIKTKAVVFSGLPHGFWTVFRDADFTKEYNEKIQEGFAWLLEQSRS